MKAHTSNHNLKSPDYHHNEISFTGVLWPSPQRADNYVKSHATPVPARCPDLQPLPADKPFIQFNISAATDRKRQVVSFPIPQNYLSLGCILNQVHVPHSTSQRPRKRFYITSSHAPNRLQSPTRKYLAFSAPPESPTSLLQYLTKESSWLAQAIVRNCSKSLGSPLSQKRKFLKTSQPCTIRCMPLFHWFARLPAFRSLCQIGYLTFGSYPCPATL